MSLSSGYGPTVSCGISTQLPVDVAVVVAVLAAACAAVLAGHRPCGTDAGARDRLPNDLGAHSQEGATHARKWRDRCRDADSEIRVRAESQHSFSLARARRCVSRRY